MNFTLEYRDGDIYLVGPNFNYLIESVDGLLKVGWFHENHELEMVSICEHAVKMAADGRIGYVGRIDEDVNVHLSKFES